MSRKYFQISFCSFILILFYPLLAYTVHPFILFFFFLSLCILTYRILPILFRSSAHAFPPNFGQRSFVFVGLGARPCRGLFAWTHVAEFRPGEKSRRNWWKTIRVFPLWGWEHKGWECTMGRVGIGTKSKVGYFMYAHKSSPNVQNAFAINTMLTR